MTKIEFEIERVIQAPIEAVFARLADIEGHNAWMPRKGSIFRTTRQTSAGEPRLGTTYVDQTAVGSMPGEIFTFEQPTRIDYHWWEEGRRGRTTEGWPGYLLEAAGDGATRVRHRVRLRVNGIRGLATPVYRWLATRERTATLAALQASFAREG